MRKVLLLLLVAAVLVIGLGFYLNWLRFAFKDGDEQSTISITIDKAKIQSDLGNAEEKVKDRTEKNKAIGGEDSEKTERSAPAIQAKDKDH